MWMQEDLGRGKYRSPGHEQGDDGDGGKNQLNLAMDWVGGC